jgi:hypothetical protein
MSGDWPKAGLYSPDRGHVVQLVLLAALATYSVAMGGTICA